MLDFSGHHNDIHAALSYPVGPEELPDSPLRLVPVYRSGKIFFCHNNAQSGPFQMVICKKKLEILI